MADNDAIVMPPDTGTIPGYKPPTETNDPYAKKAVTEMELGKMTMWAWGARKASLDSKYCPEYEDIVSATNNTINATGSVNGVAETSYKIITSASPGSNDKLLKRNSVAKNSVKCTININHDLSTAPGDYWIRLFLTNSASTSISSSSTLTTSVCDLQGKLITEPGADGWKDFTIQISLVNLINGGNINRDAYVGIELYNADWDYSRDVWVGVKKYVNNAWADLKTLTKVGDNVKAVKAHLGIKWRDLVANRYRLMFELRHRNDS
jgi:hypothetical protein